jgi:hypothetical protein
MSHKTMRWAALMLAVPLAALALASSALAAAPTGEFANFAQCPLANPAVNQCLYGVTTSGEFTVGKTTVPIVHPITFQGGIIANELTGAETFVEAANGVTLSHTPQPVPGGLLGIMSPSFFPEPLKKIFNEFIENGPTGVNATTELVGLPKINRPNLIEGKGAALTLPIRVHLENALLGPKCYIGSASHPITIPFTTGTTNPPAPNKPITGSPGEYEERDGGELVILRKNSLVENAFAAPGAEGCGSQILFGIFTGVIDGAINSKLGLPSAAGHNTAILKGTLENATAEAVKKSE